MLSSNKYSLLWVTTPLHYANIAIRLPLLRHVNGQPLAAARLPTCQISPAAGLRLRDATDKYTPPNTPISPLVTTTVSSRRTQQYHFAGHLFHWCQPPQSNKMSLSFTPTLKPAGATRQATSAATLPNE